MLNKNMMNALVDFQGSGVCFALVMLNEETGEQSFHPRVSQPCYGELRTYGSSHGEDGCTRPKDRRPSDLGHPFPDGTPIGLCVLFNRYHSPLDKDTWNDYVKVFWGKNSPWKRGFNYEDLRLLPNPNTGVIDRIILTDLAIDPTVLVNGLMSLRRITNQNIEDFRKSQRSFNLTDNEALLFSLMFYDYQYPGKPTSSLYISTSVFGGYVISPLFEPVRFVTGETKDITGGTLRGRYAYNRPEISQVFGVSTCNFLQALIGTQYRSSINHDEVPGLVSRFKAHIREKRRGAEAA